MSRLYVTEIKAGNLVKCSLCTHPAPNDSHVKRAARSAATAAAREWITANRSKARGVLELRLAANFCCLDMFVTLTYKAADVPHTGNRKKDKAQLTDDINRFIRQYRAGRRKRGHTLKYIYVFEGLHTDNRYHVHIIINGEDGRTILQTREDIKQYWTHGNIKACTLLTHPKAGKTPGEIASYLTKENLFGNALDERLYVCSRGLIQAEKDPQNVRYYMVNDVKQIAPPHGARVINENPGVTIDQYGKYAWYSYLLTEGCAGYVPPAYDCTPAAAPKRRKGEKGN